MSGDIIPYLQLITSEHNQKPKYMAFIGELVQAFADQIDVLASMVLLYDVDVSVSTQEDATGLWTAITRHIAGLSTPLDDDLFRTVIKAKIAVNNWDGTTPSIIKIWNDLFTGSGYVTLVQDNCDMSMIVAFYGPVFTGSVFLPIVRGGYLDLKPAGVDITYLGDTTPGNVPFFGFNIENTYVKGFDEGYFGTIIA
jgi:Protein of unknown function (DUF2612)